MTLPLPIRTWIANWRFKRLTRPYDRAIAAARKAHKAVRHIQRAKQQFVHQAPRGAG